MSNAYDKISKDSIEAAYCFVHQKRRVYEHSTMAWQKDDIEYAIASYAEAMNANLYAAIANGKRDFLTDHSTFATDLSAAEERLDNMMHE